MVVLKNTLWTGRVGVQLQLHTDDDTVEEKHTSTTTTNNKNNNNNQSFKHFTQITSETLE